MLATALKEFISPDTTTYVSHNLSLDHQGRKYEVQNYDSIERGRISLSQAMSIPITRSMSNSPSTWG